jgi:hypothetical protein
MSVQAVHNSQQVAQTEALSKAQSSQKQAIQQNVLPQDTITISAAAQAKQTASAIGADPIMTENSQSRACRTNAESPRAVRAASQAARRLGRTQ